MKIGFDAKRALYNRSGLGNYSRDLIYSLLRYFPQNEYFLYSPSTRNSIPFNDERAHIRKPRRETGKIEQAIWRTYKLADILKKDGITVFHGLSHELPRNIQKKGIRSVVTIHDVIFMRHPEWYNPFDVAIYKNKFRHSCLSADKIIAVSQQTKDDLVTFFNIDPLKIEVIYQACNDSFARALNEADKEMVKSRYKLPGKYLLYVGTIEKRKNLLTLLQALQYGNIKVPLVVVGRQTSYFNQVKEFLEKNPGNEIYFLKEVPVQDLPGIYQMASLFIYPSLFEGFGIPVLEALNSGTPVITSTGGCFRETGGPGSIYVEPFDVKAIAAAIEKILNDPLVHSDMVKKGLEHASKFSNEIMAQQTMKLYNGLVDAG